MADKKKIRDTYIGFYTSKLWTAQIEAAMQAYAEEYHKEKMEVKNLAQPDVIRCSCIEEDKHGETKIWCCNHCGKPIEDWWTQE